MKCAYVTIVILLTQLLSSLTSDAQTIRTIAGNGLSPGFVYNYGDGGPARSAEFNTPYGIAIDSAGNIFVSEEYCNSIRKINPNGIITTIAGNGSPNNTGDNGPATAATVNSPFLMVCDPARNLYFADGGNRKIRKIDTFGIITTVAGNGAINITGDNGPATNAAIGGVVSVCFDQTGNMYISDGNSHVRKVNTSHIITTIAGDGTFSSGGDNGPATAASIDAPGGVAADAAGNLYVSERGPISGICGVRKVSSAGVITRFAGNGANCGPLSGNGGPASAARVSGPVGVKADAAGNVYFADNGNNCIRRVDVTTGIITSVVGSVGGFSGDGGPAVSAKLSFPTDLYFGKNRKMFILDKGNRRVREVFYVDTFHITANPGNVLCGSNLASFTAHLSDAYYFFHYQWKQNGLAVGTNSPNYTPTVLHNNDIITCSLLDTANGGMLLAVSDTIHMTILPPILPSVTVTISSDTLCSGEAVTLTATAVNGGASPQFDWYVFGSYLGSGQVFSYIPSVGDVVTCKLTSSDACALPHTVQASVPIYVNPSFHPYVVLSPTPAATISYWGQIITMNTTVTYGGTSPTFQWYEHNAPIPGATSSSYSSSIYFADTFYCVMHSNAICVVPSVDTSNLVYIDVGTLGVGNLAAGANNISLYPNPNSGNFLLKGVVSDAIGSPLAVEIRNVLGQTVYTNTVSADNGKIEADIRLGNDVPGGMYFLITTDGSSNGCIPFVVSK